MADDARGTSVDADGVEAVVLDAPLDRSRRRVRRESSRTLHRRRSRLSGPLGVGLVVALTAAGVATGLGAVNGLGSDRADVTIQAELQSGPHRADAASGAAAARAKARRGQSGTSATTPPTTKPSAKRRSVGQDAAARASAPSSLPLQDGAGSGSSSPANQATPDGLTERSDSPELAPPAVAPFAAAAPANPPAQGESTSTDSVRPGDPTDDPPAAQQPQPQAPTQPGTGTGTGPQGAGNTQGGNTQGQTQPQPTSQAPTTTTAPTTVPPTTVPPTTPSSTTTKPPTTTTSTTTSTTKPPTGATTGTSTPPASTTTAPPPVSNSNRGVPPGTVLKPHYGDLTITQSGTHVDALDVHGQIIVKAANVTISRTRVRGVAGQTGKGMIHSVDGYANLVIEDTTIIPDNPSVYSNGIKGFNFTARRLDIARTVDSIEIFGDNARVENSWLHDHIRYASDPEQDGGPSHNDGVQIMKGANIVLTGNTITGATNAAVQVTQDVGAVSNLSLTGNFLDNGDCSIKINHKVRSSLGPVTLSGNRFGRGQAISGCAVLRTGNTTMTESGNVWHDNDATVLVKVYG